jgi:hypothetical protein
MIAIHTKYLPATNTKGSRIKAYTWRGFSATVSVDYALNDEIRHFEAVKALVAKWQLDWDLSDMRYGDSADGRGYVFCFDASKVQA